MKTNNTIIKRKYSYYNPYYLDGKQIENIIFYDNTGEKVSCRWFRGNGSNNEYPLFELPAKEVKRKIKLNFNKDLFFYMKSGEGINLYIPLTKVRHNFLGKKINYETKLEVNYFNLFEVELKCTKILYRRNELNEFERYEGESEYRKIEIKYNFTQEPTKFGKKVEKIKSDINKALKINNFSKYEVQRLIEAKIIK